MAKPRRPGSCSCNSNSRKRPLLQVLAAAVVSSISIALIVASSGPATLMGGAQLSSGEQVGQSSWSALPAAEVRPRVVVNLHEWVGRLSDDIRAVANRTSCVYSMRRSYEEAGKPQLLEPLKLRDNVLSQINLLLSQHRAAVSAIVTEAESLAVKHNFVKNLTVNYTDVHRIRNELEPLPPAQTVIDPVTGQAILQQQLLQDSAGPAGSLGSSSGASGNVPQFTSIGGGTPVPGPPEWQTPIKSIVMQVNKNFGDIPVNTSMSAVHLPVPIYAGQPEIMNGIAWTEKLDNVFKRNLAQFAHVHHQYYGDRLGFLRTFPAHKWRIPRLDPDLFDARTRPWYVSGSSSPKNVVILIDSSGSMTGLRREIAKGVVFEILDTLTSSDYFTVLRFSESVTPVGLPKCSNLKQPKLTLAMREQCAALLASGHHPAKSAFYSTGGDQQPLPVHSDTSGGASLRDQRLECAVFERQLERASRYPRDHEDLMLAQNGSYLTDDAYEKSIRNLTNEIRDAYMLPATSRNIRYLKSNFSMPTAGIANFTNALMGAFELLQAYERTSDMGSQCNQAIMLITDGAMKAHEELFNRYNYPNATVRLFTYMIGREVGDIRPTKAIACNNRGYYTHVINLNEVREQVLKYLTVMARPLVLAHHHPISWTPAYGDETHQVLTDWVLEIKRRERARIMLNEERERLTEANVIIELTNIQEYDDFPLVDEMLKIRIICEDNFDESRDMDNSLQAELDPLGYNELACHWTTRRAELLTSVVKPVFDNRETSLVFQRVLHKNIWSEQETHVRNAQMLGVAAVDLRIGDILKSIPSYLLGPNGYAILLGQNGFIMHHPDLRALLEDPFDRQSKILKPYFNAVDLTHIEQVYIKNESLDSASNINRIKFHSSQRSDLLKLLKLREAAIRGQSGSDQFFVKRAIDCRRRPHIRQQVFYYGPVKDTPFSLILALPVTYGLNRIRATRNLERDETSRNFEPSAYDLWTVHPDYKYCEGFGLASKDNSSVAKILEVLKLADAGSANSIHYDDLNSIGSNAGPPGGKQRIVCDAELFPALLFDAAATNSNGPNSFCKTDHDNCYKSTSFFSKSDDNNNNDDLCTKNPDEMRSKLANIYGLEMSFVATRSGLTRVRVYDLSLRIKKLADLFIQRHNKALDESWYSRTVDWNMRFGEDAIIITVPYNAYIRLVAKLRQRITQRHPAINDTRANCDPQLGAAGDGLDEEGSPGSSSNSTDEQSSPGEGSPQSPIIGGTAANSPMVEGMQNDEPVASGVDTTTSGAASADSTPSPSEDTSNPPIVDQIKIDYNAYSTYDFLDLLANSSVHISATQSVIANAGSKQRSPVAVTGLLYDYATFARRFLNATTLNIRNMDKEMDVNLKVDICPNGDCPTRCGFRNDTIDCLLVDNNGYIIVGEELPYIGRSLSVYDEKLMQSLVDRHVFHQITLIDYQAICTRTAEQFAADQKAAAAAGSSSQLMQISSGTGGSLTPLATISTITSVLANAATSLVYTLGVLYSILFYQSPLDDLRSLWTEGEPIHLRDYLVGAQSAFANQSMLAMLPNKTYLRACEKVVHLYETRPPSEKQSAQQSGQTGETSGGQTSRKKLSIQAPEYYESKCNCSAWYVYEQVPKTNLIMLIVNTTTACRRCDQTTSGQSSVQLTSAEQSGSGGGSPSLASNFVPVVPPVLESLLSTGQSSQATSNNLSLASGFNRGAGEEQVCAMLERDSSLYVIRTPPEACYSYNEKEFQIPLCGGAKSSTIVDKSLLLATSLFLIILRLLALRYQ